LLKSVLVKFSRAILGISFVVQLVLCSVLG
jgi:hypothetical protein